MFSSQSRPRCVLVVAHLLFAVVLLAPVTNAWADIVTYDIVDYPDSQGVYHLTGSTITVNTGSTPLTDTGIAIPFTDITAASIVVQLTNNGITTTSVSFPVDLSGDGNSDGGGLMASKNQLYFPGTEGTAYLTLCSSFIDGSEAMLAYNDNFVGGQPPYIPGLYDAFSYTAILWSDCPFSGPPIASQPGVSIGVAPMIIATAVPEPASLTLLISALVGLGAFYLRRRRATV